MRSAHRKIRTMQCQPRYSHARLRILLRCLRGLARGPLQPQIRRLDVLSEEEYDARGVYLYRNPLSFAAGCDPGFQWDCLVNTSNLEFLSLALDLNIWLDTLVPRNMFPIDQRMLSADVSGYRYYRRILSNKQKKQSTSFAWVPSVEYRGPTPVCHPPDPCYPAYCGLLCAILASSATHLQSQPGVTWHHSARYFKGSKTNRKNDQSQPLPPYGRFRRSHPCPSVRGGGTWRQTQLESPLPSA